MRVSPHERVKHEPQTRLIMFLKRMRVMKPTDFLSRKEVSYIIQRGDNLVNHLCGLS